MEAEYGLYHTASTPFVTILIPYWTKAQAMDISPRAGNVPTGQVNWSLWWKTSPELLKELSSKSLIQD